MVNVRLIVFTLLVAGTHQFVYKHHDNEEIYQELQAAHNVCPNITRVYTLTETSVLGVPLYVIEFSTTPGHHQIRKLQIQPFKFVNFHSNNQSCCHFYYHDYVLIYKPKKRKCEDINIFLLFRQFEVKPEFKYVGNMHGNEVLGRELLLKLVWYLCEQYTNGDPAVADLIRETRIHILPSMNPDGWQQATDTVRSFVTSRYGCYRFVFLL